jgi:DNA (cytosine-5)-methyltransferase 1
MSLYGGRVASEIIEDLEKIGYSVSVSKLWAADFGVPQLRRRAIFVALRTKSINFQFPDPTTPDRKLTCWDAISDLPTLRSNPGSDESEYQNDPRSPYQEVMRRNSKVLYNHWAVIHKAQTIETISLVPDGGNYKDLPIELQRTRNVNIAWTRMNSKKPCFTIDAGHNHHFHYRENRVPTVRESARIQSFPDNFRFVGKKTSQFRQVGNAVPPLLALAIADQLKGYLK